MKKTLLLLVLMIFIPASQLQAEDNRQLVQMPDRMKNHMLSNMRDHLLALQEISGALAKHEYEKAADTAEQRLGMSSLKSHGASHMARVMPKQMAEIGTNMHKAASRFAVSARDAEVDGSLDKALSALSDVMEQCVACHAGYRVH